MNPWMEYALMALFPLWLVWRAIHQHHRVVRRYYDAIYAILRVLDLSLESWQQRYKRNLSEEEWFGFELGYTQGLRDALKFLEYPTEPPLHTNRLEPRPEANIESQKIIFP